MKNAKCQISTQNKQTKSRLTEIVQTVGPTPFALALAHLGRIIGIGLVCLFRRGIVSGSSTARSRVVRLGPGHVTVTFALILHWSHSGRTRSSRLISLNIALVVNKSLFFTSIIALTVLAGMHSKKMRRSVGREGFCMTFWVCTRSTKDGLLLDFYYSNGNYLWTEEIVEENITFEIYLHTKRADILLNKTKFCKPSPFAKNTKIIKNKLHKLYIG